MGYTASSIHKAIEYFEEDFSHYKKFQQITYQKMLSQSLVNFTLDIKMDVLVPSKERVGFKKHIEDSYGILLPKLVIDRNVFRTMLLLFLLGLSI